ncbi:SpaA isopeptide-forming pilin-related protein [Salinicoccus hispanicus]|uniref:VWA domain-containing protein n=1 Tax=Salinicoccus hispanicus TaxID=157225 RepID=A0A6N8U022_9STAP|nr:vWA domain-containing protein [Salinicoccus hispanicus]MXQ51410.1 VWA domain-containing protein [Salinicoccus hispanicus]
MKIRKISFILLAVLLLHSTFLDTLVFANQSPENTGGTGLVEVEGHEENDIMTWRIKVNDRAAAYTEGTLNFQLYGGHELDAENINILKETVGTLEERSDGTYTIQLDDPSKASNFVLTTKITDQHTSNYTLSVEASLDQHTAKAADIHHTMQNIEGTITFKNLPEDEKPPATLVHLFDTAASETVGTLEVPPDEPSFIFKDIRKYDDDNSEIIYEIKTEPLGNYTTVGETEIVHEYLEAEVEGMISNTSRTAFSIEVANDQTGTVIRTIDIEPDAHSYKIEELPLNDAEGNAITYSIYPIAQEAIEITVKDNNIEVNDIKAEENAEKQSEETSAEQPENSSEAVQKDDETETSVDEPVKLEEETVGPSEENEAPTEEAAETSEETQEKPESPEVDTTEINGSEIEAALSDNEKDKEALEESTEESNLTEESELSESEAMDEIETEVFEETSEKKVEISKTQKLALEETKSVSTEATTFGNLTQEYSFMPRMATALGAMSISGEQPLFPGCENTMASPFPGIASNQSNIDRMGWQEYDLYRNRTPQPIKYDEGYLQKCATPNDAEHSYSINVSTQGSATTTAQPLDIVLVLDNSSSMDDRYADGTTRWQRTRAGVVDFVKTMTEDNNNVRISIVNYSTEIVSSSSLTNDTARILSSLPQKNPGGGTFTQRGLIKGEEILSYSPDDVKKVMVLLTDGAPTYSYKGESVSERGNPETINKFESTYYGKLNMMGDGTSYHMRSFLRHGYYISHSLFSYTHIVNHGQPTISQAKLIKDNNPDWDIFTVGIDLENKSRNDGASLKEMNELLGRIASDPTYAYNLPDPANGLPGALHDIQDKISVNSFSDGKITDPIGEMYDLDLGPDKVFDASDYTLTASSAEIKNTAKISYNTAMRTLSVTGVNLGKNDWLNLNYNVILRTGDPNFQMNTWYAMNGRTTAVPTKTSNRVLDYPIPEARALPKKYDFIFTKTDENDKPLAGAKFQLKNSEGSITATSTSRNDGKVIFPQISVGDYVLMETSAPNGYQPDGIKYKVTIGKDGTYAINGKLHDTKSFSIKNMPKLSKLKIINHTPSSESEVLPGSTFELRDLNGKVISTGITDKNGELIFSELRSGDYLLVMTKAPAGHSLNSEPMRIALNGQDIETIEIENAPQMLPETGGMGTIPFFAIGLFIVFMSLFSKNRLKIK